MNRIQKRGFRASFIALFFLLIGHCAQAQSYLDSAIKYQNSPELALSWAQRANHPSSHDTTKARSLLVIGMSYNELSSYDSARNHLNRSLSIYKRLDDSLGMARVYDQLGVAREYQSQYREALANYEASYLLHKALHLKGDEASGLNNMGNIYVFLNDYAKALSLFQEALRLAVEANDEKLVTNIYNNIGMVHDYTNDLDKALEYYELARAGYERLKNQGGLAGTLNNLGIVYKNKGEPRKAIPYYEKALAYYTRVKSNYGVAVLQNNLGVVYDLINDRTKALQYHEKALATNTLIGNMDGIANSNNSLGESYLKLRSFERSEVYFLKGLEVAKSIPANDRIAEALEGLSRSREGMGDYKKAFEFSKAARVVRDSILSVEKYQKLYEMEQKYESAIKEKQIALLNSETEKQKLEIAQSQTLISKRNLQLAFVVSSLVLIAIAVYLFYSRLTIQQKAKLQVLQNENDQAVIRSIYEQRISISKDMHDEIGSGLTHIAMRSELLTLQQKSETVLESEIQIIADTSRKLIQSMSEIIWAINPENETLDNFVAYLREQTYKYFEPFDVRYTTELPSEVPFVKLTNLQRRNLFLVTKETLNNALKHAGASAISLALTLEGPTLFIVITDDGVGFEHGEIRKTANGLKNMTSRMREINGTCSIETSPLGTCITFGMPLKVS